MDYCIYDRNDACTHDCEDCRAYALRCASCGTQEEELYDTGLDILCIDCLIEEEGSEYYADFAGAMESEFRDYVISVNSGNRVHSSGYDSPDEDLY